MQSIRQLENGDMKCELKKRVFSHSLQHFHKKLFTFPWEKQFPGLVFIRDYDELPLRAPFDIDLMAPSAIWANFHSILSDLVNDLDLVMTSRRSAHSFLILIFDPVISAKQQERTWVYFEVRDVLMITQSLTISSHDVVVDYTTGIPVPNHVWRFFLVFVQGLRKSDLMSIQSELIDVAKYDTCVTETAAKMLGVKNSDVKECLSSEVSSATMRERLGIIPKPVKTPVASSWTTSLKHYVEKRLFFVHLSKPFLYTLHGADGVGKTTVSATLKKVFDGYPISFETFHHVTSWKHVGRKRVGESDAKNIEQPIASIVRKPLWRRGVSLIYSCLPEGVRNIWVLSSGYARYCINLDGKIMHHDRQNFVMLTDRYLHDMWVKNRLTKNGLNILHRLYALALRKPRLAILLVDEPKRVFERKQELSVEEISNYQLDLEDALKSTKVRYVRVSVNGRSGREVAREITSTLLNDIGPSAINLMRAHVQKMKTSVLN